MIKYDNNYYKKIIRKFKYNKIKGFLTIPNEEAKRRWISSFNLKPVIKGAKNKEKTLITMGIGINSTPHLGTIMQLLNVIYLQKNGFKVQIVLGDLDVYGARSINLNEIKKTINKYKRFIVKLGFDPKKGVIRTQYEREDINQTAYLISNYINDSDFYEIEEDINELYKKEKKYEGMSFGVKQSITLMFADFIHPGFKEKYKHVIVINGIDEHGYSWKAEQIRKKMNLDMTISCLHTKLLPGLNGFPKMSKSLTKSSIDFDIKKKDLQTIFNSDDSEVNNLILQLIENVSIYSIEDINIIRKHFKNNSIEWQKDKEKYLDYLLTIQKYWR